MSPLAFGEAGLESISILRYKYFAPPELFLLILHFLPEHPRLLIWPSPAWALRPAFGGQAMVEQALVALWSDYSRLWSTVQLKPSAVCGPPSGLHMYRPIIRRSQCCFFNTLTVSRMRMRHACHIFCRSTEFHDAHGFHDHIRCSRSANMRT